MKRMQPLSLPDKQGRPVHLRIGMADTFIKRLSGLLFRRPLHRNEGLLLTRCSSVHMFGMRHAIDLVWLDREGWILQCTPDLKPWRASACRGAYAALELAHGAIGRLRLQPGMRLPLALGSRKGGSDHVPHTVSLPCPEHGAQGNPEPPAAMPGKARQRGASMVEFTLVAPLAMLLILAIIQVGMVYAAKLTLNHAAFMAARTGANTHADKGKMLTELTKGLIPFYQNALDGNDLMRLTYAFAKAKADRTLGLISLDILNPSPQSFADFGIQDPDLGTKKIPNDNLQFRARTLGTTSQQSIQDANLLKIKATYGYELKVPLMAMVFKAIMCGEAGNVRAWSGGTSGFDADNCALYYRRGRIPILSYATVRMQSPAFEGSTAAAPGPDDPPAPTDPNDPNDPADPGNSGSSTDPGTPTDPGKCDPATDPNQCRSPLCRQGDKTCDPGCGTQYCCTGL